MNPNAVNQIIKGTDFYSEGETVTSIAMIVKGRVMIHNEGAKIIVGSGTFLGINDLYTGRYQSTYTAYDELVIYVFSINRIEEMDRILSMNKDYHGFMVASFNKMIDELDQIYQGIKKQGSLIYEFLTETYKQYAAMAARIGIKAKNSDRIDNLKLLESDLELVSEKVNYYIECKSIPIDVIKSFYSYGNTVTLYQLEDQINIVNQQIESLKDLSNDFAAMALCLVDETDTCLFRMTAEISLEMDNSSGINNEIMDIMDNIIDSINQAEIFVERMMDSKLTVNRKRMEEVYHLLLTSNKNREVSSETYLKYSKEDAQNAINEMRDSFHKILNYAGIESLKAEDMKTAMRDFVHKKDKFAVDSETQNLRRKLVDNHYIIYQAVFLKAYNKKVPRIIDLFLKYGFADERLLTKEQLLSIYYLKEEEQNQGFCRVHNIKSWLTMIYEGKKEPSKNEFDMEYPEMLANMKRQGKLTDKEVVQWQADSNKKLDYEIQNMFRYNNRTTNGQITTFVPFLHKDQWTNHIERLHVNVSRLNEAVADIMKIDYSVFDREVLYVNNEKKIAKEYIVKRIAPDIILMPTIGSNGIMWQEITGKRRDSEARFLLPIFTDTNITTLLTRIFGRYRWELCRTIEGAAWNDIKEKSLTSEYSDYLQFYRKNKELSEEKKEKVKHQIQKGRNNSREIFVIDYEQWISFEARGAIKLNKQVREMMATYCPYAKEIREKLKLQPLFEEAMARYYREKQRKVREIESRHRLLQKEQIELTTELIQTLQYYRDF